MSRILVGAAFLFALMLAVPGPATASERRADGMRNTDMTEFSSQRWRARRAVAYRGGVWRRAAWRRAAWGPRWGVRRAAVWGPGWGVRRAAYWGGGWGYPYAYPAASVVVVRTVPAWGWGPRWGWGPGLGWGRRIWW
jgi:hypothetical protein